MPERDESPDPSLHIPVPEDGEPRDAYLNRLRCALAAIAQDLVDRDLQAKIGVSDLVQDTMLEVVRDMDRVRSKDPRQFERWCREVLLNNFRDVSRFFRRARRRTADQELPLTSDMPDPRSHLKPDLPLLKEEQLLHMREAIGRLPAPHQQMLKWRYMDRYSYRKIADLVARKEDAVRMMVNRSLDRLKREMSRLNDSTA